MRSVGLVDDAAVTPLDKTRFLIVSLAQLNELIRAVKCKSCNRGVNIRKEDREYGLDVKLLLMCATCNNMSVAWSSPCIDGESKKKPFAINDLGARTMQSTGNQRNSIRRRCLFYERFFTWTVHQDAEKMGFVHPVVILGRNLPMYGRGLYCAVATNRQIGWVRQDAVPLVEHTDRSDLTFAVVRASQKVCGVHAISSTTIRGT